MNTVRVVFTLVIVVAICVLAFFQMNLKGYEKVERINEWVLYYDTNEEVDEDLDYPRYIVKSGFEEKSLDEAIDDGLFDESELELILELIEERN